MVGVPKKQQTRKKIRVRTEKIRLGVVFNLLTKPRRDVFLATAKKIWATPDVDRRFFLSSPATRVENLVQFVGTGLDGLIVCGVRKKIILDFCRRMPQHPPIVVCSYEAYKPAERELLEPGGMVVLDNVSIGRTAADYLLSHELRNFVFLGTNVSPDRIAGQIRSKAFAERLRKVRGRDMTFQEKIIGTCTPNEDYWDETPHHEDWIQELPRPCGVFTNGDREAFVFINYCKMLGIKVPAEIEVMGVNNALSFCQSVNPTLTSLYPNHQRTGEEAVRLVLALIANPKLPASARTVMVSEVSLVKRGSTAGNRNYGKIVARARDFIQQNACKGISVDDVVAAVGGSRSALEKRVHAATGGGILAMIQKVRLERVCHLLSTTELPITQITLDTGYGLSANQNKIFKREFGMSMRDYRASHRGSR